MMVNPDNSALILHTFQYHVHFFQLLFRAISLGTPFVFNRYTCPLSFSSSGKSVTSVLSCDATGAALEKL